MQIYIYMYSVYMCMYVYINVCESLFFTSRELKHNLVHSNWRTEWLSPSSQNNLQSRTSTLHTVTQHRNIQRSSFVEPKTAFPSIVVIKVQRRWRRWWWLQGWWRWWRWWRWFTYSKKVFTSTMVFTRSELSGREQRPCLDGVRNCPADLTHNNWGWQNKRRWNEHVERNKIKVWQILFHFPHSVQLEKLWWRWQLVDGPSSEGHPEIFQ